MKRERRVLLIDDDETLLMMFSDILSENGFTVTKERSAVAALDRLLRREKFDLVITDIRMAEMDGWTLLDTIRKELKIDEIKLPVIVISAYDSSVMELNCLSHRANAWLVKPVVPLSRLVEEAKVFTGGRGSDGTD